MVSEETKKKIQQVASVCIRCRRCMKECIMLNRFAQNPKVLFEQYLEMGPENMDKTIAYSCNECSQCTLRCPKGLNLKAVFQSLKADYAAENHGIVPLKALLSSETGQQKECSSAYCTTLTGSSVSAHSSRPKYIFAPGKFPPEPIMEHLHQSLGRQNVRMLPGVILEQVSEEALQTISEYPDAALITACPSSFRSLKKALPERKILFYWDLMYDLIGLPSETKKAETPLTFQGLGDFSSSIRWVAETLGCQWQESPSSSDSSSQDRDCRQILGLLFEQEINLNAMDSTQKKEGCT